MAGLAFWLRIVTVLIVLAISWGLYFEVTSVVGFDAGVTLEFLGATVIVITTVVSVELLVRRRRARHISDLGV